MEQRLVWDLREQSHERARVSGPNFDRRSRGATTSPHVWCELQREVLSKPGGRVCASPRFARIPTILTQRWQRYQHLLRFGIRILSSLERGMIMSSGGLPWANR